MGLIDLSGGGDGNVSTEQVDVAIQETQNKADSIVVYINAMSEVIKQESGKGDPFVGLLFLFGSKGLPYVEELLKEAISSSGLPPLPDWVYKVPGGAAGALVDVAILYSPITKRLPKRVQAVVTLMTALSWGAAIGGPIVEGWLVSKFGEGSFAQKAASVATQVLSSANPRLIIHAGVKAIASGGWGDPGGAGILHNPDKDKDEDTAPGFWDTFKTGITGGLGLNQGGLVDLSGAASAPSMKSKFYNKGGEVDIKKSEGFREDAYWDPHGQVWTIGYGTTKYSDGSPVQPGDKITEKQADEELTSYTNKDLAYIDKFEANNGYNWTPEQKQAIASFTYNLGQGALNQVTNFGQRSDEEIAEAMLKYTKAGGVELPGLVARRQQEAAQFSAGSEGYTTKYDEKGKKQYVDKDGNLVNIAGAGKTYKQPTWKEQHDLWLSGNVGDNVPGDVYGTPGKDQGYLRDWERTTARDNPSTRQHFQAIQSLRHRRDTGQVGGHTTNPNTGQKTYHGTPTGTVDADGNKQYTFPNRGGRIIGGYNEGGEVEYDERDTNQDGKVSWWEKQMAKHSSWSEKKEKIKKKHEGGIDTPGWDKVKAFGLTAADFIPIIGDAKAAYEVIMLMQEKPVNWPLVGALAGATVVGMIPGIGDAAAAAIKAGAKKGLKAVEGGIELAKRIEVDPNTLGSTGGNIRLKPKEEAGIIKPKSDAQEAIDNPRHSDYDYQITDVTMEPRLEDVYPGVKEEQLSLPFGSGKRNEPDATHYNSREREFARNQREADPGYWGQDVEFDRPLLREGDGLDRKLESVDEVGQYNREKAGEFSDKDLYETDQYSPDPGLDADAAFEDLFAEELAEKAALKTATQKANWYKDMWDRFTAEADELIKKNQYSTDVTPDKFIRDEFGMDELEEYQAAAKELGYKIEKRKARIPNRKEQEAIAREKSRSQRRRSRAGRKKSSPLLNAGGIIQGYQRPVKKRRSIIG